MNDNIDPHPEGAQLIMQGRVAVRTQVETTKHPEGELFWRWVDDLDNGPIVVDLEKVRAFKERQQR